MQTILVPVDFSTASGNAIRYAIELAKQRGSKIELLHVYPIPIASPDMPAEMILAEQIMTGARDQIDSLTATFKDSGVVIENKLMAGFPGGEIVFRAEQSQPELIVMGTHGASQQRNRFLGSSSLHVIDRATVPVLAIPEQATFKPWQRICCATDFDYHEIDSIRQMLEFVSNAGTDLILVHVNHGNTDDKKNSPAYRESFIEKVRQLTNIVNVHYEYITTNLNLVDELREFAVFHNADVLVMLHHLQKGLARLWHNSLTKEMSHSLPIPLFSCPVVKLEVEKE